MRIVDVTVDFETVGLGNNAALIELAATEWNRDAECSDDIFMDSFMQRIDLTSAVFNGREFETSTIKWWQSKPDAVKAAILSEQCYPEKEVLENFAAWLEECGKADDAEVVLWAQGSDFDIAILRNRYGYYRMAVMMVAPDWQFSTIETMKMVISGIITRLQPSRVKWVAIKDFLNM